MIKNCKICGISDLKILDYLINHPYPPLFIGFICNYQKSPRYVSIEWLKKLNTINKKKSKFVAVLVKPDEKILDEIKDLNFDYYQIYDSDPNQINSIKSKYQKKIIVAFTVQKSKDVERFKLYSDVANIYLFDSKGYEKSIAFNHSLLKNIKFDKPVMIAGNIQVNDDLENFNKIADIIDISGGVETSGYKDTSKIEIFLNKIQKLKNEN